MNPSSIEMSRTYPKMQNLLQRVQRGSYRDGFHFGILIAAVVYKSWKGFRLHPSVRILQIRVLYIINLLSLVIVSHRAKDTRDKLMNEAYQNSDGV